MPTTARTEAAPPSFCVIDDYDALAPFLMTLVSASDVWLYVTSSGGVTAGRKDVDGALFPYETVDRLVEGPVHAGPVTVLRIGAPGSEIEWRPFDLREARGVRRRLSKDPLGTRITFEEHHSALGLTFRQSWQASEKFGVVRRAELVHEGLAPLRIALVDGLRNLLPTGIPLLLQREFGCLTDAYKTSDYEPRAAIALYSTSAAISDRPDPQESLRVAVAWSRGLPTARVSLDPESLRSFEQGRGFPERHDVRGRKGAFLLQDEFTLQPRQQLSWLLVADVNHDHLSVQRLRQFLLEESDPTAAVLRDIERGQDELLQLLAASDALQVGGDEVAAAHHAANVLFNGMRGGLFPDGYSLAGADVARFVGERNRLCAERTGGWLAGLPEHLHLSELVARADAHGDPDLRRLVREYLPLTFGRRHGDPSRPWNRFSIAVKRDGERIYGYEGNWRDIFQNWEALCQSYPLYLDNVITKFLSAMTRDGYNPYRLSRAGIDWEVPEPENPFSHIGYWGDHQVVYLSRLLESHARFFPGALSRSLGDALYSFADVPYRIRPYAELLADPRRTIDFDVEANAQSERRVAELGADGRLLPGPQGEILQAKLAEKLLVIVLSKASNFVPQAGIWLNTQRPEWNDANNALVGNAASMVTLYHLHRFQELLMELLGECPADTLELDAVVAQWLGGVREALWSEQQALLAQRPTEPEAGRARKRLLDGLGRAFERYRQSASGTARRRVPVAEVLSCLELLQRYYSSTIDGARRPDGLFEAYVLLDLGEREVHPRSLFAMLEGQAAALSLGHLSVEGSAELIETLEQGPMYRADQNTFVLYPPRELPTYLGRNQVSASQVESSPLLTTLQSRDDRRLVAVDSEGIFRFHAGLTTTRELQARLADLARDPELAPLVAAHGQGVLDAYESTFRHGSYTGRSGTMYGYEGIGCIYWHMVSKLLLSLQERISQEFGDATELPEDPRLERLVAAYFRVRAGLCFNKTAEQYGAFPTDPYSHTPASGRAQQPGMTGQVKEGVLLRLGELGVRVRAGRLGFFPQLLRSSEFLTEPSALRCLDGAGGWHELPLSRGDLGFTYCGVPVVYRLSQASRLHVVGAAGSQEIAGLLLDEATSRSIFERRGEVRRILREVSPRELSGLGAAHS